MGRAGIETQTWRTHMDMMVGKERAGQIGRVGSGRLQSIGDKELDTTEREHGHVHAILV